MERDIWDQIEMTGRGEHLDEEMFDYLSAYADGECSDKERRLVEAYLAENPAARELLAELRAQSAAIAADRAEPPAWLSEAILSKTSARKSWFNWPAAAGLASCAAAACVGIALIMPWNSVELKPAPLVAQKTPMEEPAPQVPDFRPAPVEEAPAEAAAPRDTYRRPAAAQAGYTQAAQQNLQPMPVVETKAPFKKPVETKKAPSYPPVDYSGSQRAEPLPPDLVAMAAPKNEPEPQPAKDEGPVLQDAREKLRERLKKINQEQSGDIKEAVGSK